MIARAIDDHAVVLNERGYIALAKPGVAADAVLQALAAARLAVVPVPEEGGLDAAIQHVIASR